MSRIDSGLGWFCDSDYFVSDTGTLLGWGTTNDTHYYKTLNGGALVAKVKFHDNINSIVIMSTVENYAQMTVVPQKNPSTYTYQYNNVTWYIVTAPYGVNGNPSDYPWICYDNPLNGDLGYAPQIEQVVTAMMTEAKVYPKVDSGLGWSCDGAFYVNDANTFIGADTHNNSYNKINTGAAIVGKIHWSRDDRMNILMISTVQDNAAITRVDDDIYKGSYTIDRMTWHLYAMSYDNLNVDPNPNLEWITDEPFTPYFVDHFTENIQALLTAANVQPTAQQVITKSYLNSMLLALAPQTYNITIPASDWSNSVPYTQTITVNGLTSGLHPFMDLIVSDTVATGILETQNYNYITKVTTGTDSLTLKCYENKPTVDLTVFLKT